MAEQFISTTWPREIGFETQRVSPPAHHHIDPDEELRLRFVSRLTNPVYDYAIRLLMSDSQIAFIPGSLTVTLANTVQDFIVPLVEGFLLSVVVSTPTLSVMPGATFVQGHIVRRPNAVYVPTFSLFGDYVSSNTAPGWPHSGFNSPLIGRGEVNVRGASNGASTQFFGITMPLLTRARIQGVSCRVTTSAVAGNRYVEIQDSETSELYSLGLCSLPQAASQTVTYRFGPRAEFAIPGANTVIATLHLDSFIGAVDGSSSVVRVFLHGFQAGDVIEAISVELEEWRAL